ncbi:hypothetical protein GJV85_02225 [Sulfurimonas aquatica]|uniref:Porin n=1 Tax=Sulfurimonas aquatica TaxID=2672570 RepID=A0A975AYP1_9BACT|nr:hypothetical protein [Sulfurimonas aquatica]QSZ40979.1 hypothetical protein GJV85_02225 [Sulfurimonas aquatica]
MKKILIIFFVFMLSLSAEELEQSSYELGKGMQVASFPLYIGGYFSLDYKKTQTSQKYRVDDIALLAYGSYDKFSYMAEFEFKEFYVETELQRTPPKNNPNSDDYKETSIEQDTYLHTERLYVDYNFNENSLVRVGKYNSPIGYWNLLPVNVLRATSSNPNTSYLVFPQYTTGMGATYSSFAENEYTLDLMIQKNSDLDPTYNNYRIDEHFGIGMTFTHDNFSMKFNAGVFNIIEYYFEDDDEYEEDEKEEESEENDEEAEDKYRFQKDDLKEPERYYAHLSMKYDSDMYQIMGELGSQRSKSEFTTDYALYLQGLYRFTQKHIGIVRAEAYSEKFINRSGEMLIVGYTYRPLYPIAIKSEYQFHTLSQSDNLKLSFSMMF